MKPLFLHIFLASILWAISGCFYDTDPGFRQRDETTIRRMFKVLPDVVLVSLQNEPKTGGTFGREGLRIGAIFQFSELQFSNYISLISDSEQWVPIKDPYSTPSIDKEYTPASLKWHPAPIPDFIAKSERSRRFFNGKELHAVKEGFYFCAISEHRQDRLPSYTKRFACSEKQNLQGWKLRLGILDQDAKKLYVEFN